MPLDTSVTPLYPLERSGEVFLDALRRCVDGLTAGEVIEIVRSRPGEAELNDRLRHSANRMIRPQGWIVEREVSDQSFGLNRVDLVMTETGSGSRFTFVEAKLKYATDAVESPIVFLEGGNSILSDAEKLRRTSHPVPRFILTWVPYVAHSVLGLRYGAGHDMTEDGFRARSSLATCRRSCAKLLAQVGPPQMVEVFSGNDYWGEITLDAWLTPVL